MAYVGSRMRRAQEEKAANIVQKENEIRKLADENAVDPEDINPYGGIFVDPQTCEERGRKTGRKYSKGTLEFWIKYAELLVGTHKRQRDCYLEAAQALGKEYTLGTAEVHANRLWKNEDFCEFFAGFKAENIRQMGERYQWSIEQGTKVLLKGLTACEKAIDTALEGQDPVKAAKRVLAEMNTATGLIRELNTMYGIGSQNLNLNGGVVFMQDEDKIPD